MSAARGGACALLAGPARDRRRRARPPRHVPLRAAVRDGARHVDFAVPHGRLTASTRPSEAAAACSRHSTPRRRRREHGLRWYARGDAGRSCRAGMLSGRTDSGAGWRASGGRRMRGRGATGSAAKTAPGFFVHGGGTSGLCNLPSSCATTSSRPPAAAGRRRLLVQSEPRRGRPRRRRRRMVRRVVSCGAGGFRRPALAADEARWRILTAVSES